MSSTTGASGWWGCHIRFPLGLPTLRHRKCVFSRNYIMESMNTRPSMVATLRHESVYSSDITSRKVCILRPLWLRHYVTKVYILPTLRHEKCVFSALYGGDITSQKVCILRETVYSRDVMLSNVSSLLAPQRRHSCVCVHYILSAPVHYHRRRHKTRPV